LTTWNDSAEIYHPFLSDPCPNHRSNQAKLEIASADLAAIAVGNYTFNVTATNFLNVSAWATRRVIVAAAGAAPVISIVGPLVQEYQISEGFKVSTTLVPESVCSGSSVRHMAGHRA
jgi:hypothetical protein